MKNLIARCAIALILFACFSFSAQAQNDSVSTLTDSDDVSVVEDTLNPDSLVFDDAALAAADSLLMAEENPGLHQQLKTKFVEGNPAFMSLVALVLVLGLAFCIERIIYLTLSEINAKKLMADVEEKVMQGDIDEGCSWITLFIAMAPSLGFLGTVIGMVMAFDQVQQAGDLSATVVAAGMKVALITTIFGIIVALILQVFYNYILTKIEHLTSQMEESAISLLDTIMKYKLLNKNR